MTKEHTIEIRVRPRPKQRPRMTKTGHAYTPKATTDFEAVIREAWDGPVFEGPIGVEIDFDIDDIHIRIWELDGAKSRLRGDLDNYVKSVLDALQGVAFLNDRQVDYLEVAK